jgi:hypothetical protein
MNSESLINDFAEGIEIISEKSYRSFLESYDYSKKNYGEATRFEATIPTLFVFDYVLAAHEVSLEFRIKFFEKCSTDIVERFSKTLENNNLFEIIKYRYMTYAKMPLNKERDEFQQDYANHLIHDLNGTKNKKSVEMDYRMTFGTDDILSDVHKGIKFRESQIVIFYWVARFIDELNSGKKLPEVVEIMRNLEITYNQEPISKRKEHPVETHVKKNTLMELFRRKHSTK